MKFPNKVHITCSSCDDLFDKAKKLQRIKEKKTLADSNRKESQYRIFDCNDVRDVTFFDVTGFSIEHCDGDSQCSGQKLKLRMANGETINLLFLGQQR